MATSSVCVDHYENAREISEAAGRIGRKINVLVEVNVGLNRCGVMPGKPALELVQKNHGTEEPGLSGTHGL